MFTFRFGTWWATVQSGESAGKIREFGKKFQGKRSFQPSLDSPRGSVTHVLSGSFGPRLWYFGDGAQAENFRFSFEGGARLNREGG